MGDVMHSERDTQSWWGGVYLVGLVAFGFAVGLNLGHVMFYLWGR